MHWWKANRKTRGTKVSVAMNMQTATTPCIENHPRRTASTSNRCFVLSTNAFNNLKHYSIEKTGILWGEVVSTPQWNMNIEIPSCCPMSKSKWCLKSAPL